MSEFLNHIPPVDDALELEPEELAGYLLVFLNSDDFRVQNQNGPERVNQESFLYKLKEYLIRRAAETADAAQARYRPSPDEQKARHQAEQLEHAVLEAWAWLERECLLVREPKGDFFVTRRGRTVKEHGDLVAMRKADLLPRKLVHPAIAAKVWPPFLRGDYDTTVFIAFKEVEIVVRKAGGYPQDETGCPLMRKAFHPETGPLTDKSLPKGERQALSDLFAGGIGWCRNPSGHRHAVADPGEAVEMILLAGYLLRIVDRQADAQPP